MTTRLHRGMMIYHFKQAEGDVMTKNTEWLMSWGDRMYKKHGHPPNDFDWCRKLAYHMGEAGNDSPSDSAILEAMKWEKEPPE